MVLNSFSAGVNTSFSSELNDNFNSNSIVEIYTSTAFDADTAGTSGTTSNSYEFTAITSGNLYKADYLNIVSDVYSELDDGSGYNVYTKLKIEVKEVGGSYSTVYDEFMFNWGAFNVASTDIQNCVNYVHTLSAGEKSNGVQVKITGSAYAGNAAANASIVNNQSRIQLMY